MTARPLRPLLIATIASALSAAAFPIQVSADPGAGVIVGGTIGAIVGGPPGAVVGAIIGGVLGHQVGGGRGRDIATAGGAVAGAVVGSRVGNDGNRVATQDVKRCETVPSTKATDYWDVSYTFRGREHNVQMSTPPGPTIMVNRDGEPRV